MVADWYLVTLEALQGLWQGFLNFMPALVGAVIVFTVGWFVSVGMGKLVGDLLKKLRFNQFFEKGAWKEALEKAAFKVDPASFIGTIVQWILLIVFLLAAVEILGLTSFAVFLNNVLGYVDDVVIAVLIFIVAVVLADILEKVVRAAVESVKIGYGHLVGVIVRWSIWIFALLAILMQLRVAPALFQTLLTGFVAVLVISAGIAFGLGGKEVAGEIIRDLYKKLKG